MRGRPVQPVRGIGPKRVKLRWCGDAKAMEPVCGYVNTFAGGLQGLNCNTQGVSRSTTAPTHHSPYGLLPRFRGHKTWRVDSRDMQSHPHPPETPLPSGNLLSGHKICALDEDRRKRRPSVHMT